MSDEGWVCPNCGRGMAPWKQFCDCVKPKVTSGTCCRACGKFTWPGINHYCTWTTGGGFISGTTSHSIGGSSVTWGDSMGGSGTIQPTLW